MRRGRVEASAGAGRVGMESAGMGEAGWARVSGCISFEPEVSGSASLTGGSGSSIIQAGGRFSLAATAVESGRKWIGPLGREQAARRKKVIASAMSFEAMSVAKLIKWVGIVKFAVVMREKLWR